MNFPKNYKDEVLDMLSLKVREINSMLDLILALGNKALLPKHWRMIYDVVGWDEPPSGNNTLKDFKDNHFPEFKEQIEEISGIASGEYQINN